MKVKSTDLKGAMLDYYAGLALGYENLVVYGDGCYQIKLSAIDERTGKRDVLKRNFCSPTSCANTFLSVMKACKIGVEEIGTGWWGATAFVDGQRNVDGFLCIYGHSPEEALFRVFVTMKLGEYVEYHQEI